MLLQKPLFLCLLVAVAGIMACSKKKNSGDTPPPSPVEEEVLKFELSGVTAGTANVALDSTFTFQVKIISKVPEKGVRVKLNVVTDPAGIPLAQDAIPDVKTGAFNITLKHLKEVKTYKVTITLSSLGNTANISTPQEFLITNKSS
ncbi:hypothetical protein [Chitinophaga solisilvae]|uniref:Lipoprotein n=1 Tax=Chitinophaga solisilvae TaxID=1233460 RepID=A0A9Q5DDC2_9BACT|nr:hypothetical protein [Chitinophaga solisilvae]NSL89732.1 hypothetical protein [Chitinophaga solisilvae]